MDNFDGAGVWRDNEHGQPLDTAGELPTGEKMRGFDELKKIVLDRKEKFIRSSMTEQMMIYALGRELDYYDECPLRDITASLAKNDNQILRNGAGHREQLPVSISPKRRMRSEIWEISPDSRNGRNLEAAIAICCRPRLVPNLL